MSSFLSLMWLSLLSRWAMLVHEVSILMFVCMAACRSYNTLYILSLLMARVNFYQCFLNMQKVHMKWLKGTLVWLRYFCFFYGLLHNSCHCNKPNHCQVLVCKLTLSFNIFMLKVWSNYYHCQAILLDQPTISGLSWPSLASIQAKRLFSEVEDWYHSRCFALKSSGLVHITLSAGYSHWW